MTCHVGVGLGGADVGADVVDVPQRFARRGTSSQMSSIMHVSFSFHLISHVCHDLCKYPKANLIQIRRSQISRASLSNDVLGTTKRFSVSKAFAERDEMYAQRLGTCY